MRSLRDLQPSARALYWYLRAVDGAEPRSVQEAAAESGIPAKTIYEQVRKEPDTFAILGRASHVRLITSDIQPT